LAAFRDVFGDFVEVVNLSAISYVHDVSETVGDVPPLLFESGEVNPFGIYQSMEVQVPARLVVGALDPIETTFPVPGELSASEFGEHCPEFIHVAGGQVPDILDGEDYVFRLLDQAGPPLDLALAFILKVVSTLRTEEKIAAIGELANLATVTAHAKSVIRVTALQCGGFGD
jgi:hypothetical protein